MVIGGDLSQLFCGVSAVSTYCLAAIKLLEQAQRISGLGHL